MKYLTLNFILFSLPSYTQQTDIFYIDSLPTEGVLLDILPKGYEITSDTFSMITLPDSN
jgi:hypothetical protein